VAPPRRIVPADTYLVTRRCAQRLFRLRPCPETNRIFMYCLAFAMQKTGVLLHAACVLSDHHHLVVTDPRGRLPDFLRELHRLTAKAMNALHGKWENLWSAEPCNVVRLVTDEDVDDKIAYVVANPVAAGLVKRPEAWPGFLAWGERSFSVKRPTAYFSEDGSCPEQMALVLTKPPMRTREPDLAPGWLERVTGAITANVAVAHRALEAAGRAFLGPQAVSTASLDQRATSYEKTRGRIPTFAASASSVRDELRHLESSFRQRYRGALEQWRAGVRNVLFPFGTWGMVVFHAAIVEAMHSDAGRAFHAL
jgi:putative transposase